MYPRRRPACPGTLLCVPGQMYPMAARDEPGRIVWCGRACEYVGRRVSLYDATPNSYGRMIPAGTTGRITEVIASGLCYFRCESAEHWISKDTIVRPTTRKEEK